MTFAKVTPCQLANYLRRQPRWTVSLNNRAGIVTYRVGEHVIAVESNGVCFLEVV